MPFESLTFSHVFTVIVDAGTHDGATDADDHVAIRANALPIISGITRFGLITGPGSDTLVVEGPILLSSLGGEPAVWSAGAGIDHVIVRGALALESGETTRERSGRFLRLGADLGGP